MDYQNPSLEVNSQEAQSIMATYMTRVFSWMTLALTITAIVAALSAKTIMSNGYPLAYNIAVSPIFWGLLIGKLLVVGFMVGLINKMNSIVATLIFLGYSVLNGITLSALLLLYTQSDIAVCFFITAGTFAFMAAYGYFTNRDLTSMGGFLMMGLVGLIIASIANYFWADSTMDWIISYAGLFLFIGLTAYDTQKIKNQALVIGNDGELVRKGAIMGALSLYLDFINLFIFILRIFGRR